MDKAIKRAIKYLNAGNFLTPIYIVKLCANKYIIGNGAFQVVCDKKQIGDLRHSVYEDAIEKGDNLFADKPESSIYAWVRSETEGLTFAVQHRTEWTHKKTTVFTDKKGKIVNAIQSKLGNFFPFGTVFVAAVDKQTKPIIAFVNGQYYGLVMPLRIDEDQSKTFLPDYI